MVVRVWVLYWDVDPCMLFVLCLDLLYGDAVLLDVVVRQPVADLEPGIAEVTFVWTVVSMSRLMVEQMFTLDEAHAAELAGVRSVLRSYVDTHMHSEVLFPVEFLPAGVAGEVLDPDVMLHHVFLQGVFTFERPRALGTSEDVFSVNLVDVSFELFVCKICLRTVGAH